MNVLGVGGHGAVSYGYGVGYRDRNFD
jgi:hypothetical protein